MPGTYVFRPIEANLLHNTDLLGKMNPYCSFTVGNEKIKSQICKKGGKHPQWSDSVTIPMHNQSKIILEVMDKDRITHDDIIGSCVVDLLEAQTTGQISKWYPLSYKNKPAGEILLETIFRSDGLNTGYNQGSIGLANTAGGLNTGYIAGGAGYAQSGMYREEQVYNSNPAVFREETTIVQAPLIQQEFREEVILNQVPDNKVFIEQRQTVEPHSFMKEVDVVETRNVVQQIEVMEAVKVLKDVQYTQAVPVKRQIEINEPHVVMREVEVMEPRVVTKDIQVIENVPVTRQVEVIENRTTVQQVQTFEPQTFTKQVEVIEHRPVMRQVQVTEPVHLKKNVEFIEPVITTKTITKQLQQAVIVDESVTQSVGPATVVGMRTDMTQQSYISGSTTYQTVEEERLRLQQGGVYQSGQTTYESGYSTHQGGQQFVGTEQQLLHGQQTHYQGGQQFVGTEQQLLHGQQNLQANNGGAYNSNHNQHGKRY